jgi:hypothetical protein
MPVNMTENPPGTLKLATFPLAPAVTPPMIVPNCSSRTYPITDSA